MRLPAYAFQYYRERIPIFGEHLQLILVAVAQAFGCSAGGVDAVAEKEQQVVQGQHRHKHPHRDMGHAAEPWHEKGTRMEDGNSTQQVE